MYRTHTMELLFKTQKQSTTAIWSNTDVALKYGIEGKL